MSQDGQFYKQACQVRRKITGSMPAIGTDTKKKLEENKYHYVKGLEIILSSKRCKGETNNTIFHGDVNHVMESTNMPVERL